MLELVRFGSSGARVEEKKLTLDDSRVFLHNPVSEIMSEGLYRQELIYGTAINCLASISAIRGQPTTKIVFQSSQFDRESNLIYGPLNLIGSI